MYTRIVRGAWVGAKAAGGPSSRDYGANPMIGVEVGQGGTQIMYVHVFRL